VQCVASALRTYVPLMSAELQEAFRYTDPLDMTWRSQVRVLQKYANEIELLSFLALDILHHNSLQIAEFAVVITSTVVLACSLYPSDGP